MSDLLFRRRLDAGHPVNLTFGQPLGPVQDAAGRLEIVLPAIAAGFEGALAYDNAVLRSDVIGTVGGWQVAAPAPAAPLIAPHASAQPVPATRAVPWHRSARVAAAGRTAAWRVTPPVPASCRARWHRATAIAAASLNERWESGRPTPRVMASGWQSAIPLRAGAVGGWQVAIIVRPSPRRIRWGAGDPLPLVCATSASVALPTSPAPVRVRWQGTMSLPPGRSSWTVPPEPEPWHCYTPPNGGAVHLLFDDRMGARGLDILFSCGGGSLPDAAIVIPVLRYYIVINSASLRRVSNNLPIPVFGLSINIDADSAQWSWSATVPLQALGDLERNAPDEPVELEATVNGHPWRLLLESLRETERFGAGELQIGGRGLAAELSDPTFPAVFHDNAGSDATAQQLAEYALTINGVPIGWSLDWQAADWLIPAGVWLHNGTALDAVATIARAAGAYLQPAPAARTLRVLPRYPVAPWAWSTLTPDFALPSAAVLERGIEHINRADYNVVFVSGQASGINARVWRDGTAADRPAQMIVDPLVTHADAARGRGIEILGNTGPQQIVTLETGIQPASGVIHVGSLLDWTRPTGIRRGLVRSLRVSATVPSGTSRDPIKVRQTIEVETHG